MCTGLKQFPDDVLDRMTLGQALMLARLWKNIPSLIHSGLVGGAAGQAASLQEKPKYTSREEVNQMIREFGPRG
jgi:hypothetical protein